MLPLILLSLLVVTFFWMFNILIRVKKNVQDIGVDLWNVKEMINTSALQSNKRDTNARKRDENILRRITKQANFLMTTQALIMGWRTEIKKDIGEVSKECRKIEGVAGKCKNDCAAISACMPKMKKDIAEAVEVMDLFKAMTEKAKGSVYAAKRE